MKSSQSLKAKKSLGPSSEEENFPAIPNILPLANVHKACASKPLTHEFSRAENWKCGKAEPFHV
jgi:hypothetical protein